VIDKTESKSATRSQEDEVAASTAKGSAADSAPESSGTELADSGDRADSRADSQGDEKPESQQAQQQTSNDASQEAPKAKSSGVQMLAAVLQLVAVTCLIAGYYLDGANILIFIKWLGAAVAAEMIVVSLLILRR